MMIYLSAFVFVAVFLSLALFCCWWCARVHQRVILDPKGEQVVPQPAYLVIHGGDGAIVVDGVRPEALARVHCLCVCVCVCVCVCADT